MSRKTRLTFEQLLRKPGNRKSISFSIAYVRVCEWVKEPKKFSRPKPDELEQAKTHAIELEDVFILKKIQECQEYHRLNENTPTPKLPKPTPEALRVADETSKQLRLQSKTSGLDRLARDAQIDKELDDFLSELQRKGL